MIPTAKSVIYSILGMGEFVGSQEGEMIEEVDMVEKGRGRKGAVVTPGERRWNCVAKCISACALLRRGSEIFGIFRSLKVVRSEEKVEMSKYLYAKRG